MRQERGTGGEVRCGYVVAARLADWEIYLRGEVGMTKPGDPWGVIATIAERDEYWLAFGESFDVYLVRLGGRAWLWRGVAVTVEGKLSFKGTDDAEDVRWDATDS